MQPGGQPEIQCDLCSAPSSACSRCWGAAAVLVVAGLSVMSFPGWGFGTDEIDRSQPVLLKSIQDISQFHAAIGNFEVIVDYEEDVRWLPGFIAGTRSPSVAGGTVNAFVDLAGMGEGDVRLSAHGQSVDIRLPAARLDRPTGRYARRPRAGRPVAVRDGTGSARAQHRQRASPLSPDLSPPRRLPLAIELATAYLRLLSPHPARVLRRPVGMSRGGTSRLSARLGA